MLIEDTPSEHPRLIRLAEPGEDVELKAMAYIWSVLSNLTQIQRDRAIQ